MKIADLYVRVSTDEQADKGYSQRNQEEVLRRYCDVNNITIRKVVLEDHSAKSFDRPEWKRLHIDLKRSKSRPNVLLFTKWDRFSRNAGDAYQMINILRSMGIEPQAIEQPLDLSVPENKIMLALYLAAPEVENDRRALNVLHGMRRARKEGRYMGKAPVGYINKITEAGRKYIAPQKPADDIMKWVFEEIAAGRHAVEQIWKEALRKGLKCSRNTFWYAIRNPAYCGKVLVSAYKNEQKLYVNGQHEAIISEALFYRAQDILDGKKKTYKTKFKADEIFQLRGYLICPRCGRLLTASASKGNGGIYHYYHCISKCGTRFKSENANELFVRELKKYVPAPKMMNIYAKVINSAYLTRSTQQRSEAKTIKSELGNVNSKLVRARDLLLAGTLVALEYKEIKSECERRIQVLEAQLMEVSAKGILSIEPLLNKAVNTLANLGETYSKADTQNKRQIIGSIYPEKLVFDGFTYRTSRVNSVVSLICKLGEGFSENKKGENDQKIKFSSLVDPYGFEP